MSAVVKRDNLGRVLPGASLNPSGRPVTALAKVRALMEPHAEQYVAALRAMFKDPDPEIRLAALKEWGDRYLGR